MTTTQTILLILQVFLAFCNSCVMIFIFIKFLGKPHDTLEQKHKALEKRVDEHDMKFKEVEESLHHGNDKFRQQADINEVFINCMLAFIDFEMAYCSATGYKDLEDLDNAKQTLRKYLAKR